MRRLVKISVAAALLAATIPSSASAQFGLNNLEVTFTAKDGSIERRAGAHPFDMTTSFGVNFVEDGSGKVFPDGAFRNLEVAQPAGFAGNPTAVPPCSTLDFLKDIKGCPDSSTVGLVRVRTGAGGLSPLRFGPLPVYNIERPPGVAAKLGFWASEFVAQTIELGVNPDPPHNVIARLNNIPQVLEVFGSEFTIWGNPADPAHDPFRGSCLTALTAENEQPATLTHPDLLAAEDVVSSGKCSADIPVKPLITLPRSCQGPLLTAFRAEGWWEGDPLNPSPAIPFQGTASTTAMEHCSKLLFGPEISVQPTTDRAESPTGLDVVLSVEDQGLDNPEGTARSDIQKAVVTLPEGVTVNPSVAEGLVTCNPAQFAAETVNSVPGQGCPEASKVGTVEVETPLLKGELLKGQLFVATQDDPATTTPGAENPFDTLIALYMVIKHPELGILVKQAGKVEPHPSTGQLLSIFDDLPQFPLGQVRIHLREGGRSPLISPARCGEFTTLAEFTPSANPAQPYQTSSAFSINRGVGGGPCPPAGPPPFAPGFQAGTINNDAGSYSPVQMLLTRRDGDQDLTKFSAILPRGLVGKLAGVGKCSPGQIASARAKTGRQELASPSCPANSQVGRVLGGAGVGSQLTFVPGSLYLAGPYKGAPLSVVSIVPAVAGPFDAGTVVVQVGLNLNPVTGEVIADGSASDPIPHILKGIPLKVREIEVMVDRNEFTLNPTGCQPKQFNATLWGSFLNLFSAADDLPVSVKDRFQAANCANLGFKPRLNLTLRGGTKRGGHPALRGLFRPRPRDANLKRTVVRLPRSAFLDQAHIRTICTRVQFAADNCPRGAVYGWVRAFTPLLAQPLEGPAYLRSSSNELPDLVFDLRGLVDIEASARIDSIKGGIRATFSEVPDAPISKVVVNMQGGKKGLIVNSRNLCAGKSRANVGTEGHNGRQLRLRPVVRPKGCKGKKRKGAKKRG